MSVTEGYDMDDCCVCLVSNAAYQRYLDFALWQLGDSGLKTFVICDDDVAINGCAERIRSSEQPLSCGISEYPTNPILASSFRKLSIPYAEQLRGFRKILYIDVDIELRDGWTAIFDQPQSKPILAAKDVGIGRFFVKWNRHTGSVQYILVRVDPSPIERRVYKSAHLG